MPHHIMKVAAAVGLAAVILAGCSDQTDELIGSWTASVPAGELIMEFKDGGVGKASASGTEKLFKWQRMEGTVPDGYQGLLHLSNPESTAKDLTCAYKIVGYNLSYANCELQNAVFTRVKT